jgi:TPP-dependent pyruvate/acetoin dehydrogenase alpha subunit
MRTIGKVVGENVSPEMQDMAKNLRNLATLVEGGTCVAVGVAWALNENGKRSANNTFCGDDAGSTLLGGVTLLQHGLIKAINEQ